MVLCHTRNACGNLVFSDAYTYVHMSRKRIQLENTNTGVSNNLTATYFFIKKHSQEINNIVLNEFENKLFSDKIFFIVIIEDRIFIRHNC